MSMRVIFRTTGNPDVLEFEEMANVPLGANDVAIDQKAIGVNFIDVSYRNGALSAPLPSGLGIEAAGVVIELGASVVGLSVGDRVGYILGPLGAYATTRVISADRVVRLPDDIAFDTAASVLLKGTTAQYLLRTTYDVRHGSIVLMYGVGGALGQIMAPWAKALGATLIGVVSKEASVERAQFLGCDHVLVWGKDDIAKEVARLTDGRKADVVYDGIGFETFDASLDSLRSRGVMVSLGASSGLPEPISVSILNAKGSLFLTRPSLAAHATDVEEYRSRVADVFAALDAGIFSSAIWKSFALHDAAYVHSLLESGKSGGPMIMKP